VKYISTRGQAPVLNFEQVLLTGLASDGGLYVPETLPRFSHEEIAAMATLDYPQLAQKIITPFVHDCIPADDLRAMVVETYAEFRHNAVRISGYWNYSMGQLWLSRTSRCSCLGACWTTYWSVKSKKW
jgi:threonine synthase